MLGRRNKVCVCGHFAFGKTYLNGQTIKTKVVTKQLEKSFGKDEILKIDSHGGKKRMVLLPFLLFVNLFKCKNFVILPAQNGLRVIPAILLIENILFRRKLHYVVIGGWLPEFLENRKILISILKRFDCIYVETKEMQNLLRLKGFDNVAIMPNCKELKIIDMNEITLHKEAPYKLCTFSRVMKEKGIEDAINAVKEINENNGKVIFELDIYGQIDSEQEKWFQLLKKEFPNYVRYRGMVPFDKSVEVLKDYFALLFPTYYEGEGFAGTLIDAMASGVPVISSDWKYNAEIIIEGYNGMLFPTRDVSALVKCLDFAVRNLETWNNMRFQCQKEAKKYSLDECLKVLVENMD